MNILNKLTIKNLKLNKKRTIVTIIGIILSTALICAVAGMVSSLQATLVENAKVEYGNRHITIEEVSKDNLKYFKKNKNIENIYITQNIGYALIENNQYEYQPYYYIVGYSKEAFENTTLNLIKGRLPKNASEIVIQENMLDTTGININIGDRLSLDIGDRTCSDGSILNQNNPYYVYDPEYNPVDECHETLDYKYTKEYTVVGIIDRYPFENYESPGFTAITYMDNYISNSYDVSLLFKNPKYYETYINSLINSKDLKNYNYNLNEDLLRWQGASLSDSNESMIYAVAGVIIAIIILTSIFVIRNSFNISASEKTKQYGMLASIGATSKQIKKNVLHEGFVLGLIGIPLGILSGVFADFVLCQIVNWFIGNITNDINFVFSVSFIAILLSILLGVITIYFSVISAARKASKISPIEAIRNNKEIRINAKKLKTPKIIGKLFGIGGEIAYKNLKRARKKYRTTVISLVVSISVFIALASFMNYGFLITNQYYKDIQYNISVSINNTDENKDEVKNIYKKISLLNDVNQYSIHRMALLKIDFKKYMSDEGFFRYYGYKKNEYPQEDYISYIEIRSLGNEEYKRYVESIGGTVEQYENSGILIDDLVYYVDDKYKTINAYDIKKYNTFSGNLENDTAFDLPIIKRTSKRPMGLESIYNSSGMIIVSDKIMDKISNNYIEMFINSDNVGALEKNINEFLESTNYKYNLTNIEEMVNAEKSMLILVAIFLYGFIIVISLIGITNIFNTITTNINLRSKEFAMLKSIGMTKKEFNKMIRLESLFYGTKSLIIGIPLGLLGSFAIYKAFLVGNDMGYIIPWQAIIIAIIVVFMLISLIMHFSVKKINNQNIIETIRNDNI